MLQSAQWTNWGMGQLQEVGIDFGILHRSVTDFVCHIIIGFESVIWYLHLYDVSLAEMDFSNLQSKAMRMFHIGITFHFQMHCGAEDPSLLPPKNKKLN